MNDPKNNIAIIRPGALGDVFCLLTLQQAIRKKYGGFDLYTASSTLRVLEGFIKDHNLVDNLFDSDVLAPNYELYPSEQWYKNKPIKLIAYPFNEGYPFNSGMKKHLKQYMEKEININSEYDLLLQSKPICLETSEDYITIQTKAGWSRYKEWSSDQWEELIKIIKQETTLKVHQIGAAAEPVLEGVDFKVMSGFDDCIHHQCYAKAHVGIDSIFNHTTDVIWSHKAAKTPAVIIFGSTCHTGFGYEGNENIFLDISCQPCYKENIEIVNAVNRSPCWNDHICMRQITPEMVWERLKKIL